MRTSIGGGPWTARAQVVSRPPVAALVLGVLVLTVTLSVTVTSAPATGQAVDPDGGPERDPGASYDEILGEEARLVAAVDAANQARQDLLGELATLNRELAATEERLAEARTRLAEAEAAAARAERALEAARQRVREATAALREQAVAAYMSGGRLGEAMQAIENLVTGDGDEAAKTLEYAGVAVDHQQDLVDEVRTARRVQARHAEEAVATRAEAEDVRNLIAASRDAVQLDRLRVADLERRAADQQARERRALADLRSRKVEIESRVIDRRKTSDSIAGILGAQQGGQADYVDGAIEFVHPLPGYEVGGEFGMRHHPILDYTRLHAGADIGGRAGEPIRAAADGVVVAAGPRGGYGRAVVIDHGHGIGTVSAHMIRTAVEVGQLVPAGETIGFVGSTGLSTGPHLHFETRLRGTPVNPRNFVDFTASG